MPTKKKAPASKIAVIVKEKKPHPKARHTEAFEASLRSFAIAAEFLRQGNHAKALELFEVVGKNNPEEPVLSSRARTYATICARKLALPDRDPETADELYFAGVVHSNDGRVGPAIAFLDRAAALDPSSASILYARASARALAGQADGASSDLRQAVALDPRCRHQAANDPDFDKVRDDAVFIDVIEPTPDER
jgi:tetratricopeptide (TPR) repeat protein